MEFTFTFSIGCASPQKLPIGIVPQPRLDIELVYLAGPCQPLKNGSLLTSSSLDLAYSPSCDLADRPTITHQQYGKYDMYVPLP